MDLVSCLAPRSIGLLVIAGTRDACPYQFPIPNHRFRIPDSRFPIPDFRFPFPNSQFPFVNFHVGRSPLSCPRVKAAPKAR